ETPHAKIGCGRSAVLTDRHLDALDTVQDVDAITRRINPRRDVCAGCVDRVDEIANSHCCREIDVPCDFAVGDRQPGGVDARAAVEPGQRSQRGYARVETATDHIHATTCSAG